MDERKLIDEIVEELLKRIDQSDYPSKKQIAVIGKLQERDKDILNSSFEILQCNERTDKTESILIAELTIPMLVNLAIGNFITDEEKAIIHSLLEGKKVYALEPCFEYRKYKVKAHGNLYSLYKDYETKLRNYGIEIIDSVLKIEESDTTNRKKTAYIINENPVVDKKHSENTTVSKEIDFTSRNVLLESDLMKLQRHGVIKIDLNERCIITPLADDYIKDHGIQIRKKSIKKQE